MTIVSMPHALRGAAVGSGARAQRRPAAAALEPVEAHDLPRRHQHRGALRPHRLGPAVHPQRHGLHPQRDGAAVHHRVRRRGARRRAHHGGQAGRPGHRLPGRHRAGPAQPRGRQHRRGCGPGGGGHAGGGGRLRLLRDRLGLHPPTGHGHAHHRAAGRQQARAAAGGDLAGHDPRGVPHDHRAGAHLRAARGRPARPIPASAVGGGSPDLAGSAWHRRGLPHLLSGHRTLGRDAHARS